jgi:hypothetical protein
MFDRSSFPATALKDTTAYADEASSRDSLHSRFEMERFDHSPAYSFDGASTNMAEEYFSRLLSAADSPAPAVAVRARPPSLSPCW